MKHEKVIKTNEGDIKVFIKESSFIAKLAAWKLNAPQLAIVIGNTIHLYQTSVDDFLKSEKWLRHELCHIKQFRDHGFVRFILLYIMESMKKGYINNRYEVEARNAERTT